MPSRRRRPVTPRDPDRVARAAQYSDQRRFADSRLGLRIAHVGTLAVAGALFAYLVSLFQLALLSKAMGWAFAASTIVLAAKLLDERPSAARRRRRSRVWASVHALIRDGVRMISCASGRAAVGMSPSVLASPAVSPAKGALHFSDDEKALDGEATPAGKSGEALATATLPKVTIAVVSEGEASARAEELLGVLASFPVALHHHIIGIRALPHPPLIDLLPPGYLSSLKRTDARVRFAASHAGPSGSGSPHTAKNGLANGSEKEGSDDESDNGSTRPAKKSNLQTPYPANLPLSLLRLMEAYILGLGGLPAERGGWTALQAERALDVVKGLNEQLAIVEGVYDEPPPLIDVRLCLNIALAFLPLWLATAVRGWLAVLLATGVASWAKFVLEPALTEPDPAANNHPLKCTTLQTVHEAVDTCPALARYYRARLVSRVGADAPEVAEHDRRHRRDRDEWLPTFS
ncbi:hypothetical protein CspeluHIS016_0600700 [Cutaneotrichosporon spelunceum]|uniref:Uncharacterized protein n=1 Tax=Cutaneotrichosporon spelunceum TaxID=1672016 RepID=A0AAD3YDZ5_9TREE|nr:hypothetical protein CspeluHIS016_0600700 [Cutaneotrichosporon spelunceum]